MFVCFVDCRCPGDHFGGHFGVLEHPEAPQGTTETQRERKGTILHTNCKKSLVPQDPFWSTVLTFGVLFVTFFAVLKREPKRLPKGSAQRASGGFPSRRELIFHFCSRTQKGIQNGSQNGAFWKPRSPLYYFLEDFVRADF